MKTKQKNRKGVLNFLTLDILLLFGVVFVIKFVLSYLPPFDVDMGTWISWAHRMAALGPSGFYSDEVWTQYTPGFLYYLWMLSELGIATEMAVKLPNILADLFAGMLLYRIVLSRGRKTAVAAFILYTLNPALVFGGSVWGQIDGILSLVMLVGVYLVSIKRYPAAAGLAFAFSFLLKPQALALTPALFVIGITSLSKRYIMRASVAALVLVFALSVPFFPGNPVFGLIELVEKMTGHYAYTSVFAFNFWSLIGMWRSDAELFLGVSYHVWGWVLFILASGAGTLVYLRGKRGDAAKYLLVALILMAAFLFPTRVHERYIIPVFAFLLPAGMLFRSRFMMILYALISVLVFLNLYHPYAYYTDNFLSYEPLFQFTSATGPSIGFILVVAFFLLLFRERVERFIPKLTIEFQKVHKMPDISKKSAHRLLMGVLVFALMTRIINLGYPAEDYFDEIYHAFTARQMLAGDARPWHWSSEHPEGFAYEWTHPPLAKEIMAGSMAVFGVNSFAWRVPGALLGVVVIFTTYLIALKLFGNRQLALFASVALAFDGLLLTMSRIGTADIYFVAFALVSYYLFLQKRDGLAALFLGFSAASKWSTLWLLPLFFVSFLIFQRKVRKTMLWYLVLPPLVYLASYLPMFGFGHDLSVFWGMQKQMWWYHSGLTATHPYTSPWWQWPLMIRPVYLFQYYKDGMVSNIYALGNPFFFWTGLLSIALSLYLLIKQKVKSLFIIIFAYLVLFAPWAMSPRIMFVYHYLPSLPFLSIALSYVLKRYSWMRIPVFGIIALSFVYFYPHWSAVLVPEEWDKTYYWLSSWR